jgi:hypothetical protein
MTFVWTICQGNVVGIFGAVRGNAGIEFWAIFGELSPFVPCPTPRSHGVFLAKRLPLSSHHFLLCAGEPIRISASPTPLLFRPKSGVFFTVHTAVLSCDWRAFFFKPPTYKYCHRTFFCFFSFPSQSPKKMKPCCNFPFCRNSLLCDRCHLQAHYKHTTRREVRDENAPSPSAACARNATKEKDGSK